MAELEFPHGWYNGRYVGIDGGVYVDGDGYVEIDGELKCIDVIVQSFLPNHRLISGYVRAPGGDCI